MGKEKLTSKRTMLPATSPLLKMTFIRAEGA